jgi:hypothetical protein
LILKRKLQSNQVDSQKQEIILSIFAINYPGNSYQSRTFKEWRKQETSEITFKMEQYRPQILWWKVQDYNPSKKSAGLQEVQGGYIFVRSTCRYYTMIRRWNNELKDVHYSLTLDELKGHKPYDCCMIWQSLRPPLLIWKWHKKYNAGKKNTGGCFNFTTTTYLQYF